MDIGGSSMKLVSENVSRSESVAEGSSLFAYGCLEDFDASDLGDHLTKFLNIKEEQESSDEIKSKFYKDDNDGSENTHYSHSGNLATEKCLIKFATFPCSSKSTSPSELIDRKEEPNDDVTADTGVLNGDESSNYQLHSHSKSLPTPLKLTSAMKGSREKLGTPPKKPGVKWAPDVYDPVSRSVSRVPKKKPRHWSDDKKNGKNKHKNSAKSSRGNKCEDKKQVGKHGSSSNSKKKTASWSLPLSFGPALWGLILAAVSLFGSSFLKKSVPKLHFAVAEGQRLREEPSYQ